MYTQFFKLKQTPFSISPDPRYLFMSERHREALAHLLYGVDSGGGIVLLTGDIGTGKTTICRCFLEQAPANCNLAYIFNPKLSVIELLQAICEEFHIEMGTGGVKDYVNALNRFLLAAHGERRNNVLIIDEAQNLSPDVLEQLRLLTNLETNERKLLQIILIGQPELRTMLLRPELEQLAQRVIAHYHLSALSEQETASYIQHRLATAGLTGASPFQQPRMKQIHRLTLGIPRRINLLCDRAMLGAYARGAHEIDRETIECAASELFINQRSHAPAKRQRWKTASLAAIAVVAAGAVWFLSGDSLLQAVRGHWFAPSPDARIQLVPREDAGVAAAADAAPVEAGVASSGDAKSAPSIISAAGELNGLGNEQEAIGSLASLWNVRLDGDDPCEVAKNTHLRCHRSNSGFAEIRKLDRPAVLKLYDGDKIGYALLTSLGDASASLRAGDAAQNISLTELTRHFRGEFVTLWNAPEGFASTAGMGDSGPGVDWIATQLARINGLPAPASGQRFNQEMQKQVRQFQRAHGLFVDGVAGPVTLMFLNRVAGLAEPRLREYPASGE